MKEKIIAEFNQSLENLAKYFANLIEKDSDYRLIGGFDWQSMPWPLDINEGSYMFWLDDIIFWLNNSIHPKEFKKYYYKNVEQNESTESFKQIIDVKNAKKYNYNPEIVWDFMEKLDNLEEYYFHNFPEIESLDNKRTIIRYNISFEIVHKWIKEKPQWINLYNFWRKETVAPEIIEAERQKEIARSREKVKESFKTLYKSLWKELSDDEFEKEMNRIFNK